MQFARGKIPASVRVERAISHMNYDNDMTVCMELLLRCWERSRPSDDSSESVSLSLSLSDSYSTKRCGSFDEKKLVKIGVISLWGHGEKRRGWEMGGGEGAEVQALKHESRIFRQ